MTDSLPDLLAPEEIQRPDAGPRRTTSLRARRSPLAETRNQIQTLHTLDLAQTPSGGDFNRAVEKDYGGPLEARPVEILPISNGM